MQREAPTVSSPRARGKRTVWAKEQHRTWYRVVRFSTGLLLRFWVRRFRAQGADRVPAQGGLFLVANHTSGMDPLLLGYPVAQRMLRGPGKVKLFQNPIFSFLLRRLGIFPIRQKAADAAGVRIMVELYRSGAAVVVYPEGTRSKSGEIMPFAPDFARLVIKLKAPIVPAAIAGGRDLLPVGKRIPERNVPIAVVYGEPFELTEYYDQKVTPEVAQAAAERMRDRVVALYDVARSEREGLLR